jgi:hypothetical protein
MSRRPDFQPIDNMYMLDNTLSVPRAAPTGITASLNTSVTEGDPAEIRTGRESTRTAITGQSGGTTILPPGPEP